MISTLAGTGKCQLEGMTKITRDISFNLKLDLKDIQKSLKNTGTDIYISIIHRIIEWTRISLTGYLKKATIEENTKRCILHILKSFGASGMITGIQN